MPIQPFKSQKTGRVEVFERFARGLSDIEGFSHIILIYWFHKLKGYKLFVKSFLDNQCSVVFSTRYPARLNQIGISVVRLIRRKDNILFVKAIDVLDGTPLLDIKPYVPAFDSVAKAKSGWLKGRL